MSYTELAGSVFLEGTLPYHGELVSEGSPPNSRLSGVDWQKRVAAEALAETVAIDPETLAVDRSHQHEVIIGNPTLYERVLDATCPPSQRNELGAPTNWSSEQLENFFNAAIRIGAGLQVLHEGK